ncbi:hypothetical protein HanRHA438_Chr13g0625761 [Helianthus annuus]|nr:hypothetical protein HanRHA438_Chr13g0625761 [Helianthus annuus]
MEFTSGRHAAVAGSDEHTTTTGMTSDEIGTASEKNIIYSYHRERRRCNSRNYSFH